VVLKTQWVTHHHDRLANLNGILGLGQVFRGKGLINQVVGKAIPGDFNRCDVNLAGPVGARTPQAEAMAIQGDGITYRLGQGLLADVQPYLKAIRAMPVERIQDHMPAGDEK